MSQDFQGRCRSSVDQGLGIPSWQTVYISSQGTISLTKYFEPKTVKEGPGSGRWAPEEQQAAETRTDLSLHGQHALEPSFQRGTRAGFQALPEPF